MSDRKKIRYLFFLAVAIIVIVATTWVLYFGKPEVGHTKKRTPEVAPYTTEDAMRVFAIQHFPNLTFPKISCDGWTDSTGSVRCLSKSAHEGGGHHETLVAHCPRRPKPNDQCVEVSTAHATPEDLIASFARSVHPQLIIIHVECDERVTADGFVQCALGGLDHQYNIEDVEVGMCKKIPTLTDHCE